jgi:lysophospholipase L1-like esterase
MPPLDHLPAYRACVDASTPREVASVCPGGDRFPPPEDLEAAVAAYNGAIADVAGQTGAVLVDLHAATTAARREGTEASLVSSDGFHPSDAGQELVAAAFARAMGADATGGG